MLLPRQAKLMSFNRPAVKTLNFPVNPAFGPQIRDRYARSLDSDTLYTSEITSAITLDARDTLNLRSPHHNHGRTYSSWPLSGRSAYIPSDFATGILILRDLTSRPRYKTVVFTPPAVVRPFNTFSRRRPPRLRKPSQLLCPQEQYL